MPLSPSPSIAWVTLEGCGGKRMHGTKRGASSCSLYFTLHRTPLNWNICKHFYSPYVMSMITLQLYCNPHDLHSLCAHAWSKLRWWGVSGTRRVLWNFFAGLKRTNANANAGSISNEEMGKTTYWRVEESRLSKWLTGFCIARGRIPAVGAFGSVGSFLFLATESSFQSIWLICQFCRAVIYP